MADFDQELDASGLNCPLPILRAKKSLAGMSAGQVLHIIATDPGSVCLLYTSDAADDNRLV